MTTVTINGQTVNNPSSALIIIFIALILIYVLPTLWNFSKLYQKAGKPSWAVIIPIYAQIIAAQIGKKPIWLAVLAGILTCFHFSSPSTASYSIAIIQSLVALALSLPLLIGMSKRYKAPIGFWYLIVLLPLAASFQVNSVKYKTAKTKTNRRSTH